MIKNKFFFIILISFCLSLSACTFKNNSLNSSSDWPAHQNTYQIPSQGNDLVGHTFSITTKRGDTLSSIAHYYDVGIIEMIQANSGINPNNVSPETSIVVPAQYILPPEKYRHGIVINIAELRLYYFTTDGKVMSFPIALGREGWRTPVGKTYVARKQKSPPWNVPKSIREYTFEKTGKELPAVVPPGEGNPLGDYAVYLGLNGYLIHGTNDPSSIGRLVSSGCIRLYNHDIETLYHQVSNGTPVYIIYYPNKVGWEDGYLYLESHKAIGHEKGIYEKYAKSAPQVVQEIIEYRPANIHWEKVREIESRQTGIPYSIGKDY